MAEPEAVRPIKILVVDDFEEFRRLVCALLMPDAEFQVAQASDGLEAIQKAEQLQPDLILLDIALPRLNGLEVAKRIREFAPSTRILFLSGESSPEVVREALNLGALGYVHKPELQNDLVPAIEAVLKGELFVSRDLKFGITTDAPRRHEILFCSDDATIVDGLALFIAASLNDGNPAIAVVNESHRNDLLDRLRVQGVDIAAAIRRGRYISLDAAVAFDADRFIEDVRTLSESAAKTGRQRPRIAVCGERAGRLWAEGKTDEAIQVEQFCNRLATTCEVDILCVYPLPHGQGAHPEFEYICREHSAVYFR